MNQYTVELVFPEVSESRSVCIEADSIEDAIGKVRVSSNTKIIIQDTQQDDFSVPVSAVYVETLRVSTQELNSIYTCVFAKSDKDANIAHTARFPDGMEMDIAACGGCEGNKTGWTEAILFKNGNECACSDAEEKYEGIWDLNNRGVLYFSVVVPESSPWIAPGIIALPGSCLESAAQVIAHQTNCKGIMETDVAYAIVNKYPEILPEYKEACQKESMLGKCQLIETEDGNFIANLFGQDGLGAELQTNYAALQSALDSLVEQMDYEDELMSVSMPCYIGCDLAGGDWDIVLEMLKKTFSGTHIRLELWKPQ